MEILAAVIFLFREIMTEYGYYLLIMSLGLILCLGVVWRCGELFDTHDNAKCGETF